MRQAIGVPATKKVRRDLRFIMNNRDSAFLEEMSGGVARVQALIFLMRAFCKRGWPAVVRL
jgi:hypothetical protein